MNISTEFHIKLEKLKTLMAAKDASMIALSRTDHFAWATCGGRSHVNIAQDGGVAAFVFDGERALVVTNRIERNRLAEEELAGLPVDIIELPWQQDRNAFIKSGNNGGGKIFSDIPFDGAEALAGDLDLLMYELTDAEMERYRGLGRLAGSALEEACGATRRGDTEGRIAGRLSAAAQERGLDPIVTLIASDEKILKFRHPLFDANKRVDKTAMLVLCARMKGLIASCTRLISFGAPDDDLAARHRACVEVDAIMNAATRPGAKTSDVFKLCMKSYADRGFAGEHELHHQGGPTGYRTRYFTAGENGGWDVRANTAFAWNPSITGTKSEDTLLASNDGNEFITMSSEWPALEVDVDGAKYKRPDILVL